MRTLWALAALLVFATGCNQVKATTDPWIRVETEDLIIRTDVRRDKAVELAKRWQALRNAIADNELPCAFERSNAPFEFVLLKDPGAITDLNREYTAGLTVDSPSARLYSRTQYVMDYREAARNTQLFAHELTHAAAALCFPGAGIWLQEGMASFYETARVRGGELVLGMPPYAFVQMENVEPGFDVYPVVANNTEVWVLPLRLAPDFDELRSMSADEFYHFGSRSYDDIQATTAYYAGSWNAMHLLQFGDKTLTGRFQTYLTRLNRGDEDDRAWNGAFGGVDVAARCDRYMRKEYKMASRPVPVSSVREPTVHGMSQAGVGLMWARLYGWSDGDRTRKAAAFLDDAEASAPGSSDVMLHRAAFEYDTVGAEAGERWLARALMDDPENPKVLATAILWYGRGEARETRRADLDAWAEALAGSAQTAFEYREYGRYLLVVPGDPRAALEALDKSLVLDATSWLTYAFAGRALAELDRPKAALRAYQTAIALTGHESAGLRTELKEIMGELREKARAAGP